MANESLFILWVASQRFFDLLVLNIFTVYLSKLLQSSVDYLDTEISIVGHVMACKPFPQISHSPRSLVPFGSAAHQLGLLLVQFDCDLSHSDFVKVRALQQRIDAMNTTHHISSLLLEVDILRC